MSEAPDQPVEAETLASGVEADAPEIETEGDAEPALDEDGNPVEPEDDDEEIEHEGAKYKLPKVLAKEFREGTLRQSDYTRKTQEVAQQREALATERQTLTQQAEAQATTIEERATLKAVEAQLLQFQNVDWAAYAAQNQEAAIADQGRWRQLEAAKGQLEGEITRKETEHRSQREQTTANALREADQVLSREVKGYGPDLIKAVSDTASTFGFSPMELRDSLVGADGKPDVRAIKVLARLSELEAKIAAHETKTVKAQTAEKVAAVQPAKTVGSKSSGYKPGLNDELPQEEWLRRRNAQLDAKAKAGGH